jgi:membrane fusion protein (multidrug efflux system)
LSYTTVVAGHKGRVTRRTVEVGNYVSVGQELMDVVPTDVPDDVWVTANFKETQLAKMRRGQRVTISVDAYPDEQLTGHIDSIQNGTGAVFSLLPSENATGNFVKVVQRVPVKIILDTQPRHLLSPGMSVDPQVDVR